MYYLLGLVLFLKVGKYFMISDEFFIAFILYQIFSTENSLKFGTFYAHLISLKNKSFFFPHKISDANFLDISRRGGVYI